MPGVVVFAHFAGLRSIRRGWMVRRRRFTALTAYRHRCRMQILQWQAGNQHQHRKRFKEAFHAGILMVGGQAWQVHVKTGVHGKSSAGCVRQTDQACARSRKRGDLRAAMRLPRYARAGGTQSIRVGHALAFSDR
jgi:hypothetical protein